MTRLTSGLGADDASIVHHEYTHGLVGRTVTVEQWDHLPRLWATRRVGWLLDEIRLHGESKELKDEVADLRADLAEAQTAQREAEQLRGLVGLPKDELFPNGTEPVTARVIAPVGRRIR